MPHMLYLLAIFYTVIRYVQRSNNPLKSSIYNNASVDFGIVILIVILSAANFFLGQSMEQFFKGKIPGFFLLPFTILIAFELRKKDINVLLGLIFIECLVVFLEYALGITTIFPTLGRFHKLDDTGLMYFNKALGLSYNSSIVASKLFLGFLLLEVVKIKIPIKLGFQIVLLAAIFLTFNRTVFVAIGLLIGFKYFHTYMTQHMTAIKWSALTTGIYLGILLILVFALLYSNEIIEQLTRRSGTVELSGRDKIWLHYFDFIKEHFWFGNNSFKYYFGPYHAHNSFIQLIATNGIFISLLYVYMIVRNINLSNVVFVTAIMVFCIFQFGIFWGISLMDIVFFYFLFTIKETKGAGQKTLAHGVDLS